MPTYYGIEVADTRILFRQGALTRRRYWLNGHHPQFGSWAHYIHGLSGPETVIDVDEIAPSVVLAVSDEPVIVD